MPSEGPPQSSVNQHDSPVTTEEKPTPDPPKPTYPDGGLTAWLNVCGSFIVCFCTIGFAQAFGVYQDYYTRISLNEESPSVISWIGSVQIGLQFILSGFSGKLFDDGYFRYLLLGASILLVFSTFMLSITQPHHYYQVLLSQGFGQGIATGIMTLPCISLPAHYFSARRATVIGIAISGSSIAGIVLPIMLNHFFNGRVGFAWGVRILGFIALGLLTFANLVMKPRFRGRRASSKQQTVQLLKKMITDIPFMCLNAGLMLISWGLYFPVFYLQLFAVLHGIDQTLAFYSIAILNAGSCVGRIIPNYIADHFGSVNCLVPISFLSGALIFAMFGATTTAGLVVFAVLYGFASGAYLSLGISSSNSFADDISEVGNRTGFTMVLLTIPLLTGPPITGALLRAPHYEWERPIIFGGTIMIVGSALLLVSRNLLAKRRGKWKV